LTVASARLPPVVHALTTHRLVAPRLLLACEAVISTQRLTWGSLSTAWAAFRVFAVAFAAGEEERAAEGELVADELFFGSAGLAGFALAEALAYALPLATFFGAAAAAPLGDLAGAALGFDAVGDELGLGDALGVADELADGDALGLADAVADGDELGVADAVADGDELGVADELDVADVSDVSAVLAEPDDGDELADADALGVADAVGDGDELGVAAGLGSLVCLTLPLLATLVPALTLVLALADAAAVGVSDAVEVSDDVGGSDGVEAGGSDGVLEGSGGGVVGVVDEPVLVDVGVAVGVVDPPAVVPVAVGVGVAVGDPVGGGVAALTGSHDWLLAVAAASSSATL
jgi:hypothetical protein